MTSTFLTCVFPDLQLVQMQTVRLHYSVCLTVIYKIVGKCLHSKGVDVPMPASLHVYNISGATVLELDGEGRKRLGRSNFGLALKEAIQTLKHGENSRCFG